MTIGAEWDFGIPAFRESEIGRSAWAMNSNPTFSDSRNIEIPESDTSPRTGTAAPKRYISGMLTNPRYTAALA
jgi:hypothetical protein